MKFIIALLVGGIFGAAIVVALYHDLYRDQPRDTSQERLADICGHVRELACIAITDSSGSTATAEYWIDRQVEIGVCAPGAMTDDFIRRIAASYTGLQTELRKVVAAIPARHQVTPCPGGTSE